MQNKILKALFTLTEPAIRRVMPAADFPPVFIVGNVRAGTTIVYQYLAGCGEFCYFSNLERYYYRTPLSAACFFGAARTPRYFAQNHYGVITGEKAPSDGWEIFNRYFPRQYQPGNGPSPVLLQELIRQFTGLYNKPFLVKNNANTLRLFALHDLFREAIFIWVKRNPVHHIASVLRGRKANDVPEGTTWAVGPQDVSKSYGLRSELEEVCFQYLITEGFVRLFGQQTPAAHLIVVEYETFCRQPAATLDRVLTCFPHITAQRFQGLPVRFQPTGEEADALLSARIKTTLENVQPAASQWLEEQRIYFPLRDN